MRKVSVLSVIALVLTLVCTSAAFAAYNEAPMLAEKVKAGLLPPVEERLPENPVVITPYHGIGQYGGTWVRFGTSTSFSEVRMCMYGHSPLRWTDSLEIVGNWVESWESNEDKTEWTLHIRKGIKWSDGYPFTSADFMFWWEDMVLNDEVSDPIPDMFIAGRETAEITAPDEYTINIKYAAPAPLLAERLAMWINGGTGERLIVPAHYLKQFHPKYSDYKDYETFEEKFEWWHNPECPVLTEWMPVEYHVARGLILERNPYFYAVDTEGNQLPYIDRIEAELVEDMEVLKLKLINGESDMQLRPYVDPSDFSMLVRGQESGGYKVLFWDSGSGTGPILYPNWNHPDDAKRELYRKPEFRRAVSMALNRERMRTMLFFGLGELTTGTMSPKAVEYHRTEEGRELYRAWRDSAVEYNPEEAKGLLDSIGVIDYDGDGWRDMPNGAPLHLRIDFNAAAQRFDVQTNELAKTDLEAIGLRVLLNPVDSSQMSLMDANATFDIHNSYGVSDGPNHMVFPQWLVPIDVSRWAPLNGGWYSVLGTHKEGTELDKPPRERNPVREEPEPGGPIDRLQKIYDLAKVEPDEEKREQYVFDMIRIHIEEGPFFIGTVGNHSRAVVISERMRNVPAKEDMPVGGFTDPWIVPFPAISMPAQYWLAD